MTNFEDVIADNLLENIRIFNEDVIPPLKQQLIELKVEVKIIPVIYADLNTE
jgi:hypothetical protein